MSCPKCQLLCVFRSELILGRYEIGTRDHRSKLVNLVRKQRADQRSLCLKMWPRPKKRYPILGTTRRHTTKKRQGCRSRRSPKPEADVADSFGAEALF